MFGRFLAIGLVVFVCLGFGQALATASPVIPADANSPYLILSGHAGEVKFEATQAWFNAEPRLKSLREHCHYWVVSPSNPYFGRFAIAEKYLPAVQLINCQGELLSVCLACDYATSAELADKLSAPDCESLFNQYAQANADKVCVGPNCPECKLKKHPEPEKTAPPHDPAPERPVVIAAPANTEPAFNPLVFCGVCFATVIGALAVYWAVRFGGHPA